MPWLALPFSEQLVGKSLMEKHRVQGLPTLSIFSPTGALIKADALENVMEDEVGAEFPWPVRSFTDIVNDATLVTKTPAQPTSVAQLASHKTLAFYFSAHW